VRCICASVVKIGLYDDDLYLLVVGNALIIWLTAACSTEGVSVPGSSGCACICNQPAFFEHLSEPNDIQQYMYMYLDSTVTDFEEQIFTRFAHILAAGFKSSHMEVLRSRELLVHTGRQVVSHISSTRATPGDHMKMIGSQSLRSHLVR
jgi:hypothetical protein